MNNISIILCVLSCFLFQLNAPSSELDHDTLGLFDSHAPLHDEMLLTNGPISSSDDQGFNIINNTNGLTLEENGTHENV